MTEEAAYTCKEWVVFGEQSVKAFQIKFIVGGRGSEFFPADQLVFNVDKSYKKYMGEFLGTFEKYITFHKIVEFGEVSYHAYHLVKDYNQKELFALLDKINNVTFTEINKIIYYKKGEELLRIVNSNKQKTIEEKEELRKQQAKERMFSILDKHNYEKYGELKSESEDESLYRDIYGKPFLIVTDQSGKQEIIVENKEAKYQEAIALGTYFKFYNNAIAKELNLSLDTIEHMENNLKQHDETKNLKIIVFIIMMLINDNEALMSKISNTTNKDSINNYKDEIVKNVHNLRNNLIEANAKIAGLNFELHKMDVDLSIMQKTYSCLRLIGEIICELMIALVNLFVKMEPRQAKKNDMLIKYIDFQKVVSGVNANDATSNSPFVRL